MQDMGLEHPRVFSLRELKDITDNFSEERVIGRGGSGVVYKGVLDNAEEIAVKKLHNHYDSSGNKLGNGEAQFLNELMNLIGVQHQNIIRLVGYCYETRKIVIECDGKRVLASEEERVLCLEYMQGGSLKDHLSDEYCGLDWQARFNIIKGVCEGLKYLHTGSEKPIFHLDLKPENIWLDGNMIPKIGDFGISRLPVSSMQTYATENAVSGTIGYMAPEYISRNQISQKCDIYSLGFIMIRVIAGENGPQNHDPHRPSEEFTERVHESWGKRQKETMSSHSLQQVKTCTEIALRCVEYDREKRPTITDIVNELNKIEAAESRAVGSQNTEKEEHTTLVIRTDIQEQKEKTVEHSEKKRKEQVDGRSAISSLQPRQSGSVHEQDIQGHVLQLDLPEQYILDHILQLQSGLQHLRDSLPSMYNLIDGAEWRSHEHCVAELLPKLKDAVYDADDLLDEYRWYEMKVELEGNANKSPFADFFATIIQGNFNKLNDIQGRLDHLSSQLEKMGLRGVTPRFDKSVRPETSSMTNETNIFGRDNELKLVMRSLGVPTSSKRKRETSSFTASTSTSPSNKVSNESRTQSLPVLPIVGIGGVGKTTLAQHICSHNKVKSHFELRIWICVSDDFDVKRLTKEAIQSCTGKKTKMDNLDSLQHALANHVRNKRILIVLDDMWEDTLKENGDCWKRFCAPLKSAQEESMMLVTTRCLKVAEGVQTMKPVILEGLKDNDFWEFFRLCAFGSEGSKNYSELERIGRSILPKLKGSPLAAKTLGRILRLNLQESRWNRILESELWKLPQEATEILPALRLSYMYLPFHLKQCFSFCAVYPKDYKFRKEDLAEIWVAEGFVEPQGDDPIQDVGCQYFEDLVARSFYQKVSGGYVIHDLMHDMAQKVSEHDCFILRNKNDFDEVPPNVRHIYIHSSSDIANSNLLRLSRSAKLRTIICKMQLRNKTRSVMNDWCTNLLYIRVMSCASTNELPDSVGNLKHLRYLKISKCCPLSIPPRFCELYGLQILDVKTCKIQRLPDDFSNLRHLQRFVSHGFCYYPMSVFRINAAEQLQGVTTLMKNLNQFRGDLVISNVYLLSKYHAEEIRLNNKKYLYKLILEWQPGLSQSEIMQHNAVEVLQVLQPPTSLRSLILCNYPGVSLPSWFQAQMINLNDLPPVINDSIGIFPSLTDLTVSYCQNLSSLEHFLHPDYVPIIKKIQLRNCNSLLSVASERFGDLSFLEELDVDRCPNIRSGSLVSSSLKRLNLGNCGSLLENIDCCSVTKFFISDKSVMSIQPQIWSLPALQQLKFSGCKSLTSIAQEGSVIVVTTRGKCDAINDSIGIFPSLTDLTVSDCQNLLSLEHFLHLDYVPAIKKIKLKTCKNLVSVTTERFGDLGFLEELEVQDCPNIRSQSLVSPSLKQLKLGNCGSLLDNIDCCSLTEFHLSDKFVTSIQLQMWSLPALQELTFWNCKSLTSIGASTILPFGAGIDSIRALPKLTSLKIQWCDKLSVVDGLLTPEYLPAVERIEVTYCDELLSLPAEKFGSFPALKHLLFRCSRLNWQRGLVLPSSLQTLELSYCGDFSATVPTCLENLTSLVSLKMGGCQCLTSIPGNIWCSKLALLEELVIMSCPNLVSIGGAEAVAKIKKVKIECCPKLEEADRIMKRV